MRSLHSKQNSLEFRLATTTLNNQAYIHKPSETIAKTYRKRTQLPDQTNLITLPLPNVPSLLTKQQNTRQTKKSLGKSSQHRSAEKRSHSRMLNQRSVERLKVIYRANETPAPTPTHKHKIAKLVSILSFKPNPDIKNLLTQLYEANAIFEGLLQEWRRIDQHDEIDDLLAKLVTSYTGIIQDVTVKAYTFIEDCLQKYEEKIAQLQAENQSLKAVLQFQTNKFQVQMMEAENRMYEQFQKGQWGTFILAELAKSGFDVEQFIRRSEVYMRAKLEYLSNHNAFVGNKSRQIGREQKDGNEID